MDIRPNPYKDFDPSDPQWQTRPDTTYSQVLDRRNSIDIVLAPLSHHSPPTPDPRRSFAIETAAQVAHQEPSEHANGTTLLNPPLNNGWKFHKTADWARKGLEQTWEERRPGPPSPIPLGGSWFELQNGGFSGFENSNLRTGSTQPEPNTKSRHREPVESNPEQTYGNGLDRPYHNERLGDPSAWMPYSIFVAMDNQAREQAKLYGNILPKDRDGNDISKEFSVIENTVQFVNISSTHMRNATEQQLAPTDSLIRSTTNKRTKRQNTTATETGDTAKRSRSGPASNVRTEKENQKQPTQAVTPTGNNKSRASNPKNSEPKNATNSSRRSKSKPDVTTKAGANKVDGKASESTRASRPSPENGNEQLDSVMKDATDSPPATEKQIRNPKTTAHAMADYLRSIENRGTGSTKIEGWNGTRYLPVLMPDDEPGTVKKPAKDQNTQGERFALGGAGGMPFPDVFGIEGAGKSRRGIGGVAGAVEAARQYHEMARRNAISD